MNILIISTVGLMYDGITNIILSLLKSMDCSGMNIYIVETIQASTDIKHQLEELGCIIVKFPNRKKEIIQYLFALRKFIKKNSISVIHVHGNSGTMVIEMLAGFFGGCKKRIAHSHNTKCEHRKLDKMLRPFFYFLYTDAIACSNDAGKWLFGKRSFTILKNGREVQLYKFNINKRMEMRQKLGIKENDFILGHVGGFVNQKNHFKVINIYREMLNMQQCSKLILIGDGPLKEEIAAMCQDLGSKVIFLGNIINVADYLNVMDAMVLPSFFEGLPLVVMEGQINGLPCFLSDLITNECKISELVHFLPLTKTDKFWAKKIISQYNPNEMLRLKASENGIIQIKKAGYDISDSAKSLRKIYLSKE